MPYRPYDLPTEKQTGAAARRRTNMQRFDSRTLRIQVRSGRSESPLRLQRGAVPGLREIVNFTIVHMDHHFFKSTFLGNCRHSPSGFLKDNIAQALAIHLGPI
jgi:hypothetical protein